MTLQQSPHAPAIAAPQVLDLGLIGYQEALRMQYRLREQRLAGRATDTLLLLEHPPTITVGRSGKAEGLLAPPDELSRRGIALFPSERGGLVTYHGPGQVVGYAIVDLQAARLTVHGFVRLLEQVVMDALEPLGLAPRRDPQYPGVWTGDRKIAAVGVHIRRWVSIHGFALNVDPDLSAYGLFVPCGIPGRAVTSIKRELGCAPAMAAVKERLTESFSRRFGK